MTLKLEEGKSYVDGYGRKIGPMRHTGDKSYYKWRGSKESYTDSGQYFLHQTSRHDLVSEWVEPKVEPDVLPFGKLTPVEQGEILLARHMGETIEVHDHYNWGLAFGPGWYGSMSYRIKPKTKMQAEYWVVFRDNGEPLFVDAHNRTSIVKGYYKVHHPAVEIKE